MWYQHNNVLDVEGLRQIGIEFETEAEAMAFSDIVKGELETRIGEVLCAELTKAQLDEFDNLTDSAEVAKWLEKNYPNYRYIVVEKASEMKREILSNKDSIAGALDTYDTRIRGTLVDDAKLGCGKGTIGMLRRAGIDTIGELMTVQDISMIRNISRSMADHINKQLERVKWNIT